MSVPLARCSLRVIVVYTSRFLRYMSAEKKRKVKTDEEVNQSPADEVRNADSHPGQPQSQPIDRRSQYVT